MSVKSISILSPKERDSLSPEEREAFELNDRIYDVHVEFDKRISEASTMADLRATLVDFVGEDSNGGIFKNVLDEISAVENNQAAVILATCFDNMQTRALSRFDEEATRIEGKVYN